MPMPMAKKCAQQSDAEFIELQDLLAEEKDVDLDQRAEKPEVGDADDGQP